MHHRPMDFEELDRLYRYCPAAGEIFHKIDKGQKDGGGVQVKAGTIATSRRGNGYLQVQFRKNGRLVNYQAHRVAWLLHTGEDPGNKQIDHIDRDRTNNRISNLRLVDQQGNMRNQRKFKSNTSGVTGIYWHKVTGKWQAQISDCGKPQSLGYFEDFFEACCARKSAENRLGYHPNHGK